MGGKGTWSLSPDCIDFIGTLEALRLGNVKGVLIIVNGKQSHMWGARYHPGQGRWWHHSNHEQGPLTQQVFANEVRDVENCSAITIKQLVPNEGKSGKKKCHHDVHFDWVFIDKPAN